MNMKRNISLGNLQKDAGREIKCKIREKGCRNMTIQYEEECQIPFYFDYRAMAEKVVTEALDHEKCPYEAEINLTLTSNEEIRVINYEYRNIDRATDVLSFPMLEYDEPADFEYLEDAWAECFNPESGELLLGDIVISVEKVLEQAEAYGHSVEREFAFLIAHSMLHLMGYDHMEPEEAKIMETKQEEILNALKINR